MKLKTTLIGIGLVSSLALQGCYTQLAMFHPEPVYDQDGEEQFYDTYSKAPSRPGLQGYAQDGSSAMPLGYASMQNRFNPFFGYGGLNYYNPYYYNGYGGGYGYGYNYYGYSHTIGGYNMFIPVGETKTMRHFNKDRLTTTGTNLRVTRNSSSSTSSNWGGNSGWTNSSNISTTRSSGSSSASSSSGSASSGSGGRRATRRN